MVIFPFFSILYSLYEHVVLFTDIAILKVYTMDVTYINTTCFLFFFIKDLLLDYHEIYYHEIARLGKKLVAFSCIYGLCHFLRGWHLEFDSPKLTKDAYRYKKKKWKIIEKWYLHLNKWSRCWWNSESLENTLIHFSVYVCLCCIRQNPDILCKPVNNRKC